MIEEFKINNQGTLILFTPLTDNAKQWWTDNVDSNCQTFGNAYCVEHQYANDIIKGIQNNYWQDNHYPIYMG